MPALILKRLTESILVLLVVALIAFLLFRFVGDPVSSMVGQDTSLSDRAALRDALGLDDPVLVQFGRFLANVVQGDFGISYRHRIPVSDLLAERLPATLELALVATILAISVGILLGVYTAIHRRKPLAQLIMTGSLIGVSLPTFLIGILLILVFGVWLRWLPTYGRGEVVDIAGWSTGLLTASGWASLVLPAFTLALFQLTLFLRLVRAEMLDVLATDYIRFCRARGIPAKSLYFRHALKNTLIPVITVMGLQIGSIIAFSIITESVFQWPGVGLMFIQAIGDADVPVMSAYLLMVAFVFVAVNLAVDLLYVQIDPRLRHA
ncbi:ABC transporter permease [Salipiger abyssi]|uniref:ABC transporter permease n=1 Tax=Salipiger abyssi TaxID=1250539 RepID=UPI0040598B88